MFAKLQSLFTRQNCKVLQAAVEEARRMAMDHWERIDVLTKENEVLKDRISEECNTVVGLIDKLETETRLRKRFENELAVALGLYKRGFVVPPKTSGVLRDAINNQKQVIEAVQRVLDSMQKDQG